MPSTKPTRPTKPQRKVAEEQKRLKDDDDSDDEMPTKPANKDAGKQQQQQVKERFRPKGGKGFRVTFEMPFRAKDIFRELCKPEAPLGFDPESASVQVVRPGNDRNKTVRPREMLHNARCPLAQTPDFDPLPRPLWDPAPLQAGWRRSRAPSRARTHSSAALSREFGARARFLRSSRRALCARRPSRTSCWATRRRSWWR